MKISILTLFPEMFLGPFGYSMIKRAIDKKLVEINFVNIRRFGVGKHLSVDDNPYGGGSGMILRVDVLNKAIQSAKNDKLSLQDQKVVLLGAHGKTYNQEEAKKFSELKHLILICGHYEGIDERVKKFIDLEISIGDFIVTGGEIPAMIVVDSVVRLIKGALKKGVADSESFSLPAGSKVPLLEYPHYTRPKTYNNMKVPEILTSGNHKEILEWRKKTSLVITKKLRPDILN